MASTTSIHDVVPLETGGVVNRKGIDFQDHVAAGFCLDMLSTDSLIAVWCESQDDITLIRSFNNIEHVEFAQCKSNLLENFWSSSNLCQRTKSASGSSILEKSLQFDRIKEPSRFRIITQRPVSKELECLTIPSHDELNQKSMRDLVDLKKSIAKKLPDAKSPNQNGTDFWIDGATWDVRHSTDAVKARNILQLRKYTESLDEYFTTDQIETIYERIVQLVWNAGLACPKTRQSEKRITRSVFKAKVREYVELTKNPASEGIGVKLQEKMQDASIPPASIGLAQDQRKSYRQRRLDSGYLDTKTVAKLEESVRARLLRLKSQLDLGQISSGSSFHSMCLKELDDIATEISLDSQGLAFLQGYMYNLTDRCQFRFSEAVT